MNFIKGVLKEPLSPDKIHLYFATNDLTAFREATAGLKWGNLKFNSFEIVPRDALSTLSDKSFIKTGISLVNEYNVPFSQLNAIT